MISDRNQDNHNDAELLAVIARCECNATRFVLKKDQTQWRATCESCELSHTLDITSWAVECGSCHKRVDGADIDTQDGLYICGCERDTDLSNGFEPYGSSIWMFGPRDHLLESVVKNSYVTTKRRSINPTVKQQLFDACRGICRGCLDTFRQPGNMEVDHIIPLHKGGTDDADNLQLLCRSCNTQKGTGTMDDLILKLKKTGIC